MKNLLVSYFLCAAGLFSPLAGLHRFYLNKPVSGVLYLITWGFFGIGTVVDLIRMPDLVDDHNLRILFTHSVRAGLVGPNRFDDSPERAILRCAQQNRGIVTTQMISLSSGLSLADSKKELDTLFQKGFCSKDVEEDGNEIYLFKGLHPKKPLET